MESMRFRPILYRSSDTESAIVELIKGLDFKVESNVGLKGDGSSQTMFLQNLGESIVVQYLDPFSNY